MFPYGRQTIEDDDIAAVAQALRGDFLTTGPLVDEFERALAEATGAREAVVCMNGTAALHLAALALDIGPDDAVVVPSLTFLATANAARYCGAEVVFADVDSQTGLMGPDHLEEALARVPSGLKPKVVFPVHLAGQCVDMPAIEGIARAHGLKIVTDSCHALGGRYRTQGGGMASVGSGAHTDLSTFSFHPVKTIAMGEGGAITTGNSAWAARMRTLRTHGMVHRPARPAVPEQGLDERDAPNPWYYEMPEPGFNYRAPDILCALGLSQLRKLERFVRRRGEIVALYNDLLQPLAPRVLPPQKTNTCDPAWHLYAARFDFRAIGKSRARIMNDLKERGVGTQAHYLPVHRQPYYRERYGTLGLPGADHYYERTLSLPLYPALTNDDVQTVVAALKGVLG